MTHVMHVIQALAGDENSLWVTPNMATDDADNTPGSYLPPFEIDFEAIRASDDRVDETSRNAAKSSPLGFEMDLSLGGDEDEPIEAYKISRQQDLVVGSQPRRRAMDMDDVGFSFHKRALEHSHFNTHKHTYIHAYIHTHTHTHTHTYIHTYIHTYKCTNKQASKQTINQTNKQTNKQTNTNCDRYHCINPFQNRCE